MLKRIIITALAISALSVPTVEASGPPKGSKCPQHYDAAMRAGWKAHHWPRLDAIMWRESRCKATAYNGNRRTGDQSVSLMQINLLAHRSWVGPMVGWDFTKLYQPETNLRVAKVLYDKCGWGPWTKPYWCRKP